MFQTAQLTFEQFEDLTWRVTYEDLYDHSGYGDTQYEALENLVLQLEEVFAEDED